MDCEDERARRLLPSFDELPDPDGDDYLQNHLASCVSCRERREKFWRLDRLMGQLLADVSRKHIDTARLDQHLLSPEGLSGAEEAEIKLHLESCRACRDAEKLLSECNEEIAGGLWNEPAQLSKSEEARFLRISEENHGWLAEFFPRGQERLLPRRENRATAWFRWLLEQKRLVWAILALVVVLPVAIYLVNTKVMGPSHTRSAGAEIRLVSPGSDETLVSPYAFRWEARSDISRYEITIKDIERPEEPIIRVSNLAEPSYQLTESEALKLSPGRLYQWEVSGVTVSRRTILSPIRVFRAPPQ